MANQLELNVLYVNTNPLKVAQTASVATSDILVYEVTTVPGVNSGIQYYNNQSNLLAYEIYYSDQLIADLLTEANANGTSLVQVPVINKNDMPFPVPVSFLFPVDGIKLTEINGGTQIEFKNDFYVTTDDINSIIDASNITIGGYKVYTALVTQSGGDDPDVITGGSLTIGVTYEITDNSGGLDMTNVGAPNNNINTMFVATGTTPNNWGTGILGFNNGAPVVTILENTIGNITWSYAPFGPGFYLGTLAQAFPQNSSFVQIVNSNCGAGGGGNFILFEAYRNSDDQIFISCLDVDVQNGTSISADSLLLRTPLEIRVYN